MHEDAALHGECNYSIISNEHGQGCTVTIKKYTTLASVRGEKGVAEGRKLADFEFNFV